MLEVVHTFWQYLFSTREGDIAMFDDAFVDRFNLKWEMNKAGGCWLWTASAAGRGYGQMKVPRQRKQEYAHRLSYMIYKGEIPKGQYVLHKCDTPLCVNPDHLFLGSQADNQQDMKNKGRSLFGERNPSRKLTDSAVRKIRQLLSDGVSQDDVAGMFGIHQMTVSKIHRRVPNIPATSS